MKAADMKDFFYQLNLYPMEMKKHKWILSTFVHKGCIIIFVPMHVPRSNANSEIFYDIYIIFSTQRLLFPALGLTHRSMLPQICLTTFPKV